MANKALDYAKYPYTQITNNEIEAMNIPWTMLDKIPTSFANEPIFLLNLDQSSGPGAHWTLVGTSSGSDKKELYYFDPLGFDNDGQYHMADPQYEVKTGVPTELSRWGRKHGFTHVYVNADRVQYLKSWMCGFIVLYIADHILSNDIEAENALQSPDGWNRAIGKILGVKGPSPKLVKKIMAWWNKTKSQL